MRRERIRRLEQAAANALPPALLQLDEGWRLRADAGGTRRANSVLAEYTLESPLSDKIERAEAFYARRGQPARFQLCPASRPEQLDEVLAARGYRRSSGAEVRCVALTEVLGRVVRREIPDAVISLDPTADWLDLYGQILGIQAQVLEARRALFRRIPSHSAFTIVRLAGIPAAVGLGVLEGGQLGLFSMATQPSLRRQGAARAVVYALAVWGAQVGATTMYLQVGHENRAARSLYTRLGFETLYSYHYREAP